MILIVGVYVYPLPGLETTIENISPFLSTISNEASEPSPSVMITFGLE